MSVRNCVLGIAGKITKQHYAVLDRIVAEQESKNEPINLVRIDPGCFGGIEWAMARGLAIVCERLNWEYQPAHTSEDRERFMIIGQPTTLEDYAGSEVYYDFASSANPDYEDPELMKPLAGDFLPFRETGKMVGPEINRAVIGDYFSIPRIDGVKVTRVYSRAW